MNLFDPDAIAADDAMLDSVLRHRREATVTTDPFRDMLARLHAGHADDEPELVTVEAAQRAIATGRWRRRVRRLWPVAFAAACMVTGILLLLLAGCGTGAIDSLNVPTPTAGGVGEARALMLPTGDGGPKVIVGATAHVTGTYPTRCVRGAGDDPRLPVMSCTPGSVRSDITDTTIGATVCNPHWSTSSIRAPQSETDPIKTVSMRVYGIAASDRRITELDHKVPLELGGSNDVSNLWAERSDEPGQGFRNSKDTVENRLHAAVCGRIPGARPVSLRAAQSAIATNWTTALAVLHIPAV